jgi:hypothetical protein
MSSTDHKLENSYIELSTTTEVVIDRKIQPQYVGLSTQDRELAVSDTRTLSVSSNGESIPFLVPIDVHSEANQTFFNKDAFFLNTDEIDAWRVEQYARLISVLPKGTQILLELAETDSETLNLLNTIFAQSNVKLELDEKIIDPTNGSIAAVNHYYSPVSRGQLQKSYENMDESFKQMVINGDWDDFSNKGLAYTSGDCIDQVTLDNLWHVYDKTFDSLVNNHPSAQKLPKDYFEMLTTLPDSKVIYASEKGEIISALFAVEDVAYCPWLNDEYFKRINPNGKTIFLPGISTRLDRKGFAYSPKLIRAMSEIVENVPSITGMATQCTNRSSDYIPKLCERFTEGSTDLKMTKTAGYRYPVFKVV